MITPARVEFIAIQLLFILQRQYRGYRWYYVTGQHHFRSDARLLIRPALASGDGVFSLKSWRPPGLHESSGYLAAHLSVLSNPWPCERH
jgi:hypothetical protein